MAIPWKTLVEFMVPKMLIYGGYPFPVDIFRYPSSANADDAGHSRSWDDLRLTAILNSSHDQSLNQKP